ncbi:hypothetical protein MRX96_025379 [Rhipicephalus microplus]
MPPRRSSAARVTQRGTEDAQCGALRAPAASMHTHGVLRGRFKRRTGLQARRKAESSDACAQACCDSIRVPLRPEGETFRARLPISSQNAMPPPHTHALLSHRRSCVQCVRTRESVLVTKLGERPCIDASRPSAAASGPLSTSPTSSSIQWTVSVSYRAAFASCR